MTDPRDDEVLRLKAKVNKLIRSNQELKFKYDSELQLLSEELDKAKQMLETRIIDETQSNTSTQDITQKA